MRCSPFRMLANLSDQKVVQDASRSGARSVREVLGPVRFSLKSYLRQPYGPTPRAESNLGLPQDLTPAALFPCLGFGKPGLEQDVICSCWSA